MNSIMLNINLLTHNGDYKYRNHGIDETDYYHGDQHVHQRLDNKFQQKR